MQLFIVGNNPHPLLLFCHTKCVLYRITFFTWFIFFRRYSTLCTWNSWLSIIGSRTVAIQYFANIMNFKAVFTPNETTCCAIKLHSKSIIRHELKLCCATISSALIEDSLHIVVLQVLTHNAQVEIIGCVPILGSANLRIAHPLICFFFGAGGVERGGRALDK